MRPWIFNLKLSIDGSMWNQYSFLELSMYVCIGLLLKLSMYLKLYFHVFCELKVLIKFAKLSLNANGPNALHAEARDMLFVMVWL